MTRTKIFICIIMLLIVGICSYLFINDYNGSFTKLNEFLKKANNENTIVIPSITNNKRYYSFNTVKETNNFVPKNADDIKDILYTILNNGWDNFTFYCPKEYEECIDDVKKLTNNSDYINIINNYVSQYNTYERYNTYIVDNTVNVRIDKLYTESEIIAVDTKIQAILSELKINKENVKIDDLKNIHNYLVKHITYDTDYELNGTQDVSSKAYGALANNKALCGGYTDTFSLILDKLNIPNFKVASKNHIWNVIYFYNQWTHVDVTWDDDEQNKNNNYNFFMVTTDELLKKDKKEHNFKLDLYQELN